MYAICYDLNSPGQDYDELFNAIKAYGTWWHNLDSTWIIKTSDRSSTIRDDLKQHIDSNDKLLVLKLSGGWAGIGFGDYDWLNEHM